MRGTVYCGPRIDVIHLDGKRLNYAIPHEAAHIFHSKVDIASGYDFTSDWDNRFPKVSGINDDAIKNAGFVSRYAAHDASNDSNDVCLPSGQKGIRVYQGNLRIDFFSTPYNLIVNKAKQIEEIVDGLPRSLKMSCSRFVYYPGLNANGFVVVYANPLYGRVAEDVAESAANFHLALTSPWFSVETISMLHDPRNNGKTEERLERLVNFDFLDTNAFRLLDTCWLSHQF